MAVTSSGTAPGSCADSTNYGNVLDFAYGFSAGSSDNGNVMGITNNRDSTRSQTFTYDPLNQIATAAASNFATSPSNCWGESFTIDQLGNLTGISPISSAYYGCTQENLSLSVGSGNQITTSGFTYDASGNLTADGIMSPVYDADGHMTSGTGVSYIYDANGLRMYKSSGTEYLYGLNDEVLDETNSGASITNEYIYFNGQRIARRDSSGNVDYYFADHLGSARVVTNSSGTILDDSDFYPYGGERVTSSGSGNPYKFTGKERDSESGLYNFGARYHSPQYQRFMSADPAGLAVADLSNPQTLNQYAYVNNNPINMTDPTGLCGFEDDSSCDDGFSISWSWNDSPWESSNGPQPAISSPAAVGHDPNPFDGETNGIPNGLQIPTLGLPGLILPGDIGCPYGSGNCGGMIFGFQGPAIPWEVEGGADALAWLIRLIWPITLAKGGAS